MAGHGASSGDAAAEEEGGDAVATDRRVRRVEPQRAEAAAGQAQCEEGDGAVCHAGARNEAGVLGSVDEGEEAVRSEAEWTSAWRLCQAAQEAQHLEQTLGEENADTDLIVLLFV